MEALQLDDLERIFIRAQTPDGKWDSISCAEATDEQFDTWIKTRMPIEGEDAPWSLEERRSVCDVLWQAGALSMIKKTVSNEHGQVDRPIS